MTVRFLTLLVASALFTPGALFSQDQFASAVGISGQRVLALKPAAGQGPATLFVYENQGDGWVVTQRLIPTDGRNSGESFSASLTTVDDRVFVGAGDPAVELAAHEYRWSMQGWSDGARLPLDESRRPNTAPQQLDMAGLMRIMQPPQRVVAATNEHLLVGVLGGAAGTNGVRVSSRDPSSDAWNPSVAVSIDGVGTNEFFGAAVDVSGGRLAISAPRAGAGTVYLLESDGQRWNETARLTSDSSSAGFGSALLLLDNLLLVGAPGARDTSGVVAVYERDVTGGSWTRTATLRPQDSRPGDGFGVAIVGTAEYVWIGAPGADGQGRVFRFEKNAAGGWAASATIGAGEVGSGAGFGSAIAADQGLLVVGAPGANGGNGTVAVFESDGDGWGSPTWLSIGSDFETVAGREVSCDAGTAAGFDCGNVDLLAFLPIAALGGDATEGVSDLWGWTDPMSGREFALVGRNGGIAFVDVTDPVSPVHVGSLSAPRSGARDLKVYNDHLFFTGDGAGAHGLLVFDLSRLRNVAAMPAQFDADAKYDGIASAHNLVIDTDAGFAYPVGASGGGETCGGGLHMVDIRDPRNPTFAGCYTDTEGLIWPGRTHDAQCVVYRGPDANYQGKQICFASNETALRIVDVTEKDNPVPVAAATYPGLSYVHQGWLTDDHRYFYLDDELDELVGQARRTRTMIWDVAELDDPVLVGEYFGPDGATDHNLYIDGNRMYQANYQAGMRVVDISDPESPVEIGFFDTTPYDGNPPGFNGAWTVYPYFESGTVVVTSMGEGLFLLRPRPAQLVP